MTSASESNGATAALSQNGHSGVSPSQKLPQIPALTGLRFFAAFSILFAHSVDWLAQFQDNNIRAKFAVTAMYGMPLFFVLSGFVIHYNYRALFTSRGIGRATCEFAAARFARLFPLYFFLLVMALSADNFIAKVHGSHHLFFAILGYYVTLTQSWWYIIYHNQSIIYWIFPLSWSISTEMFFYIAYVAAVFFILQVRRWRTAMVLVIAFAIGIMLAAIASRYYVAEILDFAKGHVEDFVTIGTNFENSYYRWLFYFSPYARVFEFLMGCLTAHAFILVRDRPVSAYERQFANMMLICALAALALFGAIYLNVIRLGAINVYVQHLALNFLCAPAIAIIMFYVGRYDTAFTRFLSSPLLVTLGDTSYSIYLIHTWTLRIFFHPARMLTWPSAVDAVMRIAFAIVLTLLVSYATYQLIEVPCRVWLRKKLGALIGAGFSRADRSEVLAAPAVRSHKLLPSARRRKLGFSTAALVMLVSIAPVGQAARSDTVWKRVRRLWAGDRPEISVNSASYGLNCRSFSVRAPLANLAAPGNATKAVKRACDEFDHCDFMVDTAELGDPVNGCGKDFSVEYRCTGSQAVKTAFIPAEAYGKSVPLDCRAKR